METFGEAMKRLEAEHFAGRTFELEYFRKMLEYRGRRTEKIINLHGTGGMGKTTLLHRYQALAEKQGAVFLLLNLREAMGSPELFLTQLTDMLAIHPAVAENTGPISLEQWTKQTIRELHRKTLDQPLVLALDQYEEAGGLDEWLRESFFPGIRSDALVVIAGRYPLSGPWVRSAVWRSLIVSMPLSELKYDEVTRFLQMQGITEDEHIDRLWLVSTGHPLALSLLSVHARQGKFLNPLATGTLEELLANWLEEVSDEALRTLVYAAAVLRSFDQELLQTMLGEPLSNEVFDRFTRLSFVKKSSRGWELHDLVRDMARQALKERMPDRFGSWRQAAASMLSLRIHNKLDTGADVRRDVFELISLTGNPILRAHFHRNRSSENYWVTAGPNDLPEIELYIKRRWADAKSCLITCADWESGNWFKYEIGGDESLYRLSGWKPEELYRFGGETLRLLRDPEDRVIGLAAMLPIRDDTLPYLLESPVSAPYFRLIEAGRGTMAQEEWRGGTFVFAVDVINSELRELRSDTVNLMMEQILAGSLLFASPPALPFYIDSHSSMGFRPVEGIEEPYMYDEQVPARTYRLDTRGAKLAAFLEQAAQYRPPAPADRPHPALTSSGGPPFTGGTDPVRPPSDRTPSTEGADSVLPGLTPREREVIELLAGGATNKEIAASLYISEAAVKKHIQSMLHKAGLKNRTQLAGAWLDSRP